MGLVRAIKMTDEQRQLAQPRKGILFVGTGEDAYEITTLPLKEMIGVNGNFKGLLDAASKGDVVGMGQELPKILRAFGVPSEAIDGMMGTQVSQIANTIIDVQWVPAEMIAVSEKKEEDASESTGR